MGLQSVDLSEWNLILCVYGNTDVCFLLMRFYVKSTHYRHSTDYNDLLHYESYVQFYCRFFFWLMNSKNFLGHISNRMGLRKSQIRARKTAPNAMMAVKRPHHETRVKVLMKNP